MSVVSSGASYQADGINSLRGPRAPDPALAIFGLDDEDEDDDLDAEQKTLVNGIFGTIYTVSRERTVTWQFVAIKLVLDVWQLLTLTINTQYGWTLKSDAVWWQMLSFIQLTSFMQARGEAFFLACLYVFVFLLLTTLVLCIWVAWSFKNKRFDEVWPITFLRFFGVTFFQLLDVASMSFFLMTMDCQYFDVDPQLKYYHQEFPNQYCWSMPYLINIAVATLSLMVFVLLSAMFQLGEIELNMATRNPLGMAHSRVEVQSFLLKFLMAAASTFLNNKKWLSTFYTTAALLLVYISVAWVPYYHAWMNYLRTAVYMSVLYSAGCMMMLVFMPWTDPTDEEAVSAWNSKMTLVMLVGLLPAAVFGALVAWLQTYYYGTYVVEKFRTAEPGIASTQIHRFKHPLEVAISARVCRTWLPKNDEVLDEQAVHIAGVILKAGVEQLPNNALMSILYSNYLFDIKGSYQSGLIDLKAAKKADPSFTERFAIFSREQQQTQRASGAKGADLVSYVEQERDIRAAIKVHKESLLATSAFWRCLVSGVVRLESVSAAVAEFDRCVQQADKVYRSVISSHPENWKLLRLYAKFVEYIKNDPWTAAKWNAEADRLFQAEDDEKYHIGVIESPVLGTETAGASSVLQAAVADGALGVIIINAQCIITNVNTATCDMLGYTRKQVLGKNVNILIPAPFAHAHDSLVLDHIKTGKSAVSNKTSYLIALHRNGHVVHIATYITRLSGEGMDSTFMAAIQPIASPADKACAWAMASGIIISVDSMFTDMFGYTLQDLPPGTNVCSLCQDPESMMAALNAAKAKLSEDKLMADKLGESDSLDDRGHPNLTMTSSPPAGDAVVNGLQIMHKFAGPISCRAVVSNEGGGGLNHFMFLMFDQPAQHQSIIVSDARGRIRHVSKSLAECLGYTVPLLLGDMAATAWDVLLPEPFCQLHRSCMQAHLPEGRPTYSCRSGITVCLMAKTSEGPEPCPFTAQIKQRRLEDGQTCTIASLDKSSMSKALSERMLSVTIDQRGTILEVGNSPEGLFGFQPQALLGRPVSCIVDVFRPEVAEEHIQSGEVKQGCKAETAALLHETVVELAVRALSAPGSCYRVGVTPPPDELDGDGQEQGDLLRSAIANYLLAEQLTPAVMKVKLLHSKVSKPLLFHGPRPSNLAGYEAKGMPSHESQMLIGSILEQQPIQPTTMPTSQGLNAPQPSDPAPQPPQLSRSSHDGTTGGAAEVSAQLPAPPPHLDTISPRASPAWGGMAHAQSAFQLGAAVPAAGKAGSEMRLELQFWRVDLLTGILDLDGSGRVVGTSKMPLYEPGPLLGVSSQSLLGAHIGDLLPPMRNRPVTDLLLPEFGAVAAGVRAKRGGLKAAKSGTVKDEKPGAVSILTIPHWTDGLPLDLSVQAVHGWGHTKGFHVVLHVRTPLTGMRGFRAWMKRNKADAQAVQAYAKDQRDALDTWGSTVGNAHPAVKQELDAVAFTSTPKPLHSPAALLKTGSEADHQEILDTLDAALVHLVTGLGHARDGTPPAEAMDMVMTKRSVGFEAPRAPRSPDKEIAPGPVLGHEGAEVQGAEVQGAEVQGAVVKVAGQGGDRTLQWVKSLGSSAVDAGIHAFIDKVGTHDKLDADGSEESAMAGPGSVDSAGGEHIKEATFAEIRAGQDLSGFAARAATDVSDAVQYVDTRGAAGAAANSDGGAAGSYRRGQRFKRIARMLTGEAVRRNLRHFKYMAWGAAGFVLAVTLAGFITMFILLQQQQSNVEVLNVVGLTGVYATNLFTALSNCDMVFTQSYVKGLPGLESVDDIQATCIDLTNTNADLMANYFTRSYYMIMGLDGPAADKIKTIWDLPVHNFTKTLDSAVPGVISFQYYNLSLWDIGNKYAAAASYMAQNIRAKNASSSAYWRLWSVPQTIGLNMDVVNGAIADTMDDLVPIVIANGLNVNKVHYILMAVEGVVCSALAVLFIFTITTKMSLQRWNLYNVFMVIPVGLLKTLATKTAAFEGLGLEGEQAVPISNQNGTEPTHDSPGVIKLSVSGIQEEGRTWLGLLARITSFLAFWRTKSTRVSPIYTKRKLNRSHLPALWLCSPFIMWGIMMIVINATGYSTLSTVQAPVAIFNLVNFVVIQFYRSIAIMQDFIQGTTTFTFSKNRARLLLYKLPTQYKAMVSGGSAVPNETSSHFTLATTGVAFSGSVGADILYNTRSCLRHNQTSCLNRTHPLYPYTVAGLDKLMQLFMDYVDTTRGMDDNMLLSTPTPHGEYIPQFSVFWNIRDDIQGGLSQLHLAYYEQVINVYRGTLTVHIVGLVLSVLLMAAFVFLMLRPYVRQMSNEAKRIAELLSMLPADVDVEGLVRSAQVKNALSDGKDDDKNASVMGSSAFSGGGSQVFEP